MKLVSMLPKLVKVCLFRKTPIFRSRISPVQIDHFIDYIARPEMLQDVAFGTNVLKLDTGGSIIIPAVIRTMIPSKN